MLSKSRSHEASRLRKQEKQDLTKRTFLQKSFATFDDIAIGFFEVARIPRVSNVAVLIGKRHHHPDLMLSVLADNPFHPPHITVVHYYDKVEIIIIGHCHLAGRTRLVKWNAMRRQASACWRIDRVAIFLVGNCCRLNIKVAFHATLLHHSLQYELGHGATTNVTVAHKQYLLHLILFFVQKSDLKIFDLSDNKDK